MITKDQIIEGVRCFFGGMIFTAAANLAVYEGAPPITVLLVLAAVAVGIVWWRRRK